jgi:hypothetical protein
VSIARQMARCAVETLELGVKGRLHIRRPPVVDRARLPDGRWFEVFRQTTCDHDGESEILTLAVWFHLRAIPSGARVRRWLFERESILNTILYAGFAGYRTKLWMVDPVSCDYAGLYEWDGADAAERYGRYITAVLRPLSGPGSVGFETVEGTPLLEYLSTTGPADPGTD